MTLQKRSRAWQWRGILPTLRIPPFGLRVIDVANPAALDEVGSYDTPGNAYDVVVAANYAYVADRGRRAASYQRGEPGPAGGGRFLRHAGYAIDVAVAGNHAYVVDVQRGGLRVINVVDPAKPIEVGFYDTPGDARGVAVAGNYAYVADYRGGLRVINVANPAVR